jgi:hypothetical protein
MTSRARLEDYRDFVFEQRALGNSVQTILEELNPLLKSADLQPITRRTLERRLSQ